MKRLLPIASLTTLWATLLAPEAGARGDCPRPGVKIEGEPDLVELLREDLAGRGVDTNPRAECARLSARVWRRGPTITVVVTDAEGRRSQRAVERGAAAAALIESWLRQDLSAGLLAGFSAGAPPPVATTVAAAEPPPLLYLKLSGEAAVGGGFQAGIGAAGCVRVGPACLGALGRYTAAKNTSDATFLASADAPFPIGDWAPFVGVAAGVGWWTTTQEPDENEASLRLALRCGVSRALGRELAVGVTLSSELSPITSDEGHEGEEPRATPPTWQLHIGLGLVVGVP